MHTGVGTCIYCGKPLEIRRNATHQCPLPVEEYHPKFAELIAFCKYLKENDGFRQWFKDHALTELLAISILNDIDALASFCHVDGSKDYRIVQLLKNIDCVKEIEVK